MVFSAKSRCRISLACVERAGTKAGNKGADAMLSAIEMINLNKNLVQ